MATEHKDLIYKVDDRPPWGVALLLGLQHLIVPVSYTVFAVLVVREIGGLPSQVQTVTTHEPPGFGRGRYVAGHKAGAGGFGIFGRAYEQRHLYPGLAGRRGRRRFEPHLGHDHIRGRLRGAHQPDDSPPTGVAAA